MAKSLGERTPTRNSAPGNIAVRASRSLECPLDLAEPPEQLSRKVLVADEGMQCLRPCSCTVWARDREVHCKTWEAGSCPSSKSGYTSTDGQRWLNRSETSSLHDVAAHAYLLTATGSQTGQKPPTSTAQLLRHASLRGGPGALHPPKTPGAGSQLIVPQSMSRAMLQEAWGFLISSLQALSVVFPYVRAPQKQLRTANRYVVAGLTAARMRKR